MSTWDIRVPDKWEYPGTYDYRDTPTVAVMVAGGWEAEPEELTAAECLDLANDLMRAAAEVDLVRLRACGDRMTNVSTKRHRTPFVPLRWKREVGLPLTWVEEMRLGMMDMLSRDMWADGIGS